MKIRKMRPAASLVGRRARQDDAFLHRRGGGASGVKTRPPCVSTSDDDLLLDAVLVDLELVRGLRSAMN